MSDVMQRARMLSDVDGSGGIGLANVSESWQRLLDVLREARYDHGVTSNCDIEDCAICETVDEALAALERELP